MCNEYSGHTNRPTWLVSLWIDNDDGMYNSVLDSAIEQYNECDKDEHEFCNQFSEWLKDFITQDNPTAESGLFTDLLQFALDIVDWYDIADEWFTTCQEEESNG